MVTGSTVCSSGRPPVRRRGRRRGGAERIELYTVTVYDDRVIRSFADGATEQIFYGEDTKVARKLPKSLWPLIRRKLDLLHAARSVSDLRQPPGDRLEALRGQLGRRYSIRVNDQCRITFRFEDNEVREVRCEDYH